ncbi:MAG: hypothetical protein ACLS9G_10605, partial [Akkermansia sp.]
MTEKKIMFGFLFFFIFLASLLILWRWRANGRMLSWKKVILAASICSLILFPMELVFRPDGVVAGRWESTGAVLVQY